jgi:hypothetical protein
MFQPSQLVELLEDLPDHGLTKGQIGRVRQAPAADMLIVAFEDPSGDHTTVAPVRADQAQLVALEVEPIALHWLRAATATPRRSALSVLLLVGLVGLGALGWLAVWPRQSLGVRIYATRDDGALPPGIWRVMPLDPLTLADQRTGVGLSREAIYPPIWANWQSPTIADSRIWVEAAWRNGDGRNQEPPPLTFREGPFGAILAQGRAPAPAAYYLPSHDGRHLVVVHSGKDAQGHSVTPWDRWSIMEARSGKVLATVSGSPAAGMVASSWLDPDGVRLYRLEVAGWRGDALPPASANPAGHWPLRLVALDLWLGDEIGRLELPEVRAGAWRSERGTGTPALRRYLWPGIAWSANGALAIAHADSDRVTMVDVERLAIERTLTLSRRAGLATPTPGDPIPTMNGAAVGAARRAAFAPDGERLYIWGYETLLDGDNRGRIIWSGVQLADLKRDHIAALALPGASMLEVLPAPDGRSVFVTGVTDQFADQPSWPMRRDMALWRLDATTLAVRAERKFAGDWRLDLVIRPAGDEPSASLSTAEREVQEVGLGWLAGAFFLRTEAAEPVWLRGTPVVGASGAAEQAGQAVGLELPAESIAIVRRAVQGDAATVDAVIHAVSGSARVRLELARRDGVWRVASLTAAG